MAAAIEALIDQLQRTRDPQIVRAVLPAFRPRAWRAGEVLMRQGEPWTDAFFIEQGLLRVHTLEPDGKDYSKSFWPEGTMVLPLTPGMQLGGRHCRLSGFATVVAACPGAGAAGCLATASAAG